MNEPTPKRDMDVPSVSGEQEYDFEKIPGPTFKSLMEAFHGDGSLFEKIGDAALETAFGRNTVGRILGIGLDIGLGFIPWGNQVQRIRREAKVVLRQHPDKFKYQPQQKGKTMKWLKHRLRERTTWQGIIAVLTGVGMSLSPDQKEAIISAGMAVVTLIWVFKKEPQSEDAKK